ncbi:caspase domain-containing protein [Streptomyces sp. NPDC056178]|uniref:caspase family protein n=1 Tax=Streptomyces sp. NPDC056178 TaxID=3345735 RepID=UPI0035DD20F9
MSRFPDPARSRAVLIGVSHFPESPELADLPAVRENVAGLWRRLTDEATGVLGPGHCEVADPEGSTADIGRAINRAAAEASDMLLIYYAGHGLVDDRGRLYLATNATRADAPKYSALGVDLLREDLGGSGAAARVLILDCCFSGRAIEVMTGEEGLLDGQLSIAGTYTMTSTTANAPSYALAGERYTAFTGALLAALDSPQPLTLDEVYRSVAADLQSRGLPRPRQRATDTAGALALARGPAEPDKPPSDPVNEVRFRRDRAAAKTQMKRNMPKPLGLVSVFVVGLPVLFAGLNHDASWLWAIPLWGCGFAALIGLITALVGRSLPLETELVIDRSVITVLLHRSTASTGTLRIPWRDISHVGVLPPKRGSVNPKLTQVYEGNHLLVVRLRPGVPFSSTKGMTFSDELHELGYRVIATIGSFGADREQILAALDQFAGDRVLHSEQEFLARDPRIQPKMF